MEFKWMNESQITKNGDRIELLAPKNSDFICLGNHEVMNAPFYYTEIKGNFVIKSKVSLDFKDTYDSATLMIMKDSKIWAKACFELTDFGTHAVVSVVTNGQSDDANGCNIEENSVWLQACRVGELFAFHYSIDGEHFYMMRCFHLPVDETLKVGIVGQAPTGDGGMRIFENLTIEQKTVEKIRKGV